MKMKHIESKEAVSAADDRLAIPLQEAARRLSMGRNAAYSAAKSGEIPTIRIGRKILVPVKALERLLTGEVA